MNPNTKTKVLTGKQVRDNIREGIDILEEAVGSTLGARGAMVGIDKGYMKDILRDGVSVARSINLKDPALNFSVDVMKESAQKTVQDVGDSTTATIVMAHALYVEAEKLIATGVHARAIFDEIEPDIKTAIELLKEKAIPVKTLAQKIQVATVSCEEESLGKLIGETIHKVGNDGVVTVENSKSSESYVEIQEGMQWDRGFASPYFITDPDTLTGTVEDGYVLVTDIEINNILELKPFLDEFIKTSRFLTIVAPEFGGDALPSLIANKIQNVFLALCVKAPSSGGQQTNMLQDIAILTGATFITKQQGHKLEDVRVEHLGKAQKVTSSQTTSILSGGEGDKSVIKERIEELKKLIDDEKNDFELERLRERLAKLTNGVAVIKIGGATDVEIKERYERALDATLATRQAVKTGIIAGGEIAYLSLIPEMKSNIVKEALKAPFKRLVSNAGMDAGQMLERIGNSADGINVITGKQVDMIMDGIIDPVAAPIAVLTNASSVALQLINTNTLVLPEEEEKK